MKKVKLGFGLTAVAAAFIMAFSTQNANALLLRETTDPGSEIVDPSKCPQNSSAHCAYQFDEVENTLIGSYQGTRQP